MIESQDAAFYLASRDPRDGSDLAVAPPAAHRVAETGLGMMYRILDLEAALAYLPPPQPPGSCSSSSSPTRSSRRRTERGGFASDRTAPAVLAADAVPDATLTIGIADLSSLVMGSLRLRDLVRHGLAGSSRARG